jgi:phosphatidate cytidylyltransferase
MSNFLQRIGMSLLFGGITALAIAFSRHPILNWVYVGLVALLILAALWEYYHIAKSNRCEPAEAIGYIGTFAYLALSYLAVQEPQLREWLTITFGLILFAGFFTYCFAGRHPLINLAVTLFGVVYLTLPLSYLIGINFEYGRLWVVYLVVVTKTTDAGAYFVGKLYGKSKLAPVISPRKTWEGAFGGFIIGTFCSYGLHKGSSLLLDAPLFSNSLESLAAGAFLSLIAQVGDLFESLLKRDSGVKDSNKLPGLGGVLDMMDSLVFTTPLLYFFLKFEVSP